jgi:hypothetical protein
VRDPEELKEEFILKSNKLSSEAKHIFKESLKIGKRYYFREVPESTFKDELTRLIERTVPKDES